MGRLSFGASAVSVLAACLLAAGCGTRNVGLPPNFLGAVITAPSNMMGGEMATWTIGLAGGVEPYAVVWNFGGGATPNNVTVTGIQRAGSDVEFEYVLSTAEVEMINGEWTVQATVSDSTGTSYTLTQDYSVGASAANLPPVVVLIADPLSGLAPLTVLFDATGSADPDGTIASLDWDFDGDGVFGEAGDEADAQGQTEPPAYTYTAAGTYAPRVRVTDDGDPALGATASVNITVSTPANQPPTVAVSATPSSGIAPLGVEFSATANDPDGAISKIEWDFDGNGTYDLDSGTTATAQYTYPAAGSYTARVRVTDDGSPGLTASGTVPVTVSPANQAPSAALSAMPLSGTVPLTVDFDASASADPDNGTLTFTWDFEDDGVIDLATGAVPTAQRSYPAAGSYTARVHVTDNGTPPLTASATVQITGDADQPPTVSLEAPATSGTIPFNVSFTATADDPDGSITKYEWDWEDDGAYDQDSGTDNAVDHVYSAEGIFTARVRVTDSSAAPGQTATATLTITVNPNQPPVAILGSDMSGGNVPLPVNFDSVSSSDPDGHGLTFEWDWEDDGTYDLNSGSTEFVQHTYDAQGSFTCRLRVTDDGTPPLSSEATLTITVGPPNQPPTAIIFADGEGGNAPFSIEMDASTSSDPDGVISLYEWDWEGDGTYDEESTSPLAQHTYDSPGQYMIRLRVTDDGNPLLTAEDTYFVFVFDGEA